LIKFKKILHGNYSENKVKGRKPLTPFQKKLIVAPILTKEQLKEWKNFEKI
jgi:hypothetical protein